MTFLQVNKGSGLILVQGRTMFQLTPVYRIYAEPCQDRSWLELQFKIKLTKGSSVRDVIRSTNTREHFQGIYTTNAASVRSSLVIFVITKANINQIWNPMLCINILSFGTAMRSFEVFVLFIFFKLHYSLRNNFCIYQFYGRALYFFLLVFLGAIVFFYLK